MEGRKKLFEQINWPAEGSYIVAVSGGVDSISLLHLLVSNKLRYRLRVAHVDHGLRADSHIDSAVVKSLARIYHLPFHILQAKLTSPSEALGRQARYNFMRALAETYQADGIITAHHWDERQETSIFNLTRGTDRRGAAAMAPDSALGHSMAVIRPLLQLRKSQLYDYARSHQLPWREDSTNADVGNARNFIRRELLPLARRQFEGFDAHYEDYLRTADQLNAQIDLRLAQFLKQHAQSTPGSLTISRSALRQLSPASLNQVLVYAMSSLQPGVGPPRVAIERLARLVRIGTRGSRQPLGARMEAQIESKALVIAAVVAPVLRTVF